jgi:hypothetical protein
MPHEKTCQFCGTTFQARAKNQSVCKSKECKRQKAKLAEQKYKGIKDIKLACQQCQKDFFVNYKNRNQQYCSKECKDKSLLIDLEKRYCKECGAKFEVLPNKTQEFCFIKCSNLHTSKNRERFEKTCIICEQKFGAYVEHHITCSDKCHTKWLKQQRNDKREFDDTCQHCGEQIINRPLQVRYCSEECQNKERYIRSNPEIKKICIICNDSFLTRREETRFCSASCMNSSPERKSQYKSGWHYSPKLNKKVHYRSSWEQIAYKWLDQNDDVVFYDAEPFSLDYVLGEKKKRYFPDILVIMSDGSRKLIEIKPVYRLEEKKNLAKFAAARDYCEPRNILFEVWTEKDINDMKQLFTEDKEGINVQFL